MILSKKDLPAILVLFPNEWDRAELESPRFDTQYRFFYEGFDLFTFPENARLMWLDGQVHGSMTVPTGEMLFSAGGLKPVYAKRVPKQGSFLVAAFTIYNLGGPRTLEASKVWLGDGKGRRYVALELAPEQRGLEALGLQIMTTGTSHLEVKDGVTARALFDLPRAGQDTLRLYVDGAPTLRVSDMPPRK